MRPLNLRAIRPALDKLRARARQKNSIYLALSLFARALNAVGMFIAIQRFAPSTFGEMSYLQATAVSTVAFCSLGIELSVNAQLSRKIRESSPLRPTILAACGLTLTGIVCACLVVAILFGPQLAVAGPVGTAIRAVSLYSSFMILTQLLTAMSFAQAASINVGVSYLMTSLVFTLFAIFADAKTSGIRLMFFANVAQILATSFMALALIRRAALKPVANVGQKLRRAFATSRTEIKTLFVYGVQQILVVSIVNFAQWYIQRKIIYGAGGTSDNAIYSVGNQIFNITTFIPAILTPLLVTRLASAGSDMALRRRICFSSLRLFAAIAVGVCLCVFVGLKLGVPYLPPRYATATETGTIASMAAAFVILKLPFSLYFLSELKASREIISGALGALVMIVATSMATHLTPNQGTIVRLVGLALQGTLLAGMFLVETRQRAPAPLRT
jgi:O-antigen/teichoic acid export membrane protein